MHSNIRYLGCLENLFIFNEQPGHELIQLYECDFADPKFYQLDQLVFAEGKRQKMARWVEVEGLTAGEVFLVPEQFKEYL